MKGEESTMTNQRNFKARWYDHITIWFSKWHWGFIAKDIFMTLSAVLLFWFCLYIILAIAG